MEIREFKNGKFQVWKGDEVLSPHGLKWMGSHHADSYDMFVSSLGEAGDIIDMLKAKEEVVKVHKV